MDNAIPVGKSVERSTAKFCVRVGQMHRAWISSQGQVLSSCGADTLGTGSLPKARFCLCVGLMHREQGLFPRPGSVSMWGKCIGNGVSSLWGRAVMIKWKNLAIASSAGFPARMLGMSGSLRAGMHRQQDGTGNSWHICNASTQEAKAGASG